MTNSDELVSIIIPCYNQGRFLGEAIASALHQSYPQVEVIVIDDGSTDNTSEVIDRFPEVHQIHQENQGVAEARNSGIRASTGRYLVFLDSDDRLLPQAIEIGVKLLQDRRDCAMVFGRYRTIAADGSLLQSREYPVVEIDHYRQLLLSNYIHTPSTVMFRRTVFETVRSFETLFNGAEDYDLYLRIARDFPIVGHDELVADYRRHDSNITGNHALISKSCLSVLRKQRRHARRREEWKEALQDGMKTYRRHWGDILFSQLGARLREGKELRGYFQDLMILMLYSLEVYPQLVMRKISRASRGAWDHSNS
jgi:glycosyltransferase involved in cell wall biosynthesis